MHKKLFLAHKNCPVCLKDFAWRKKWQSCWENVLYCSKRCQKNKKQLTVGKIDESKTS
tara:strand:+ start:2476 stop:2649 length:174 start_codon:yes stop_codon:yes gene_type:complete